MSFHRGVTLKEMRDYIRGYMRDPRIPEVMLDVWIGDAVTRILTEAEWRWLTKEMTGSVTRAAPLSSYTTIHDAQVILGVSYVGDSLGGALERLVWADAFDRFPEVRATESRPFAYSVVADAVDEVGLDISVGVRLWEPSSTRTSDEVVVRYREIVHPFPVITPAVEEVTNEAGEVTTPAADAFVDENQRVALPQELVPALRNFALAEALTADGRMEDAQAQLARYRQTVDKARTRLMLSSAELPAIGGGTSSVGMYA